MLLPLLVFGFYLPGFADEGDENELIISTARWVSERGVLRLKGKGIPRQTVVISDSQRDAVLAEVRADSEGDWRLRKRLSEAPCEVGARQGTDYVARAVANAPPCSSPPAVTLSDLSIEGPIQLEEGQTATYTALATYSDGQTADVTAQVDWQMAPDTIGTIAGGVLEVGSVDTDLSLDLSVSYTAGDTRWNRNLAVTILDLTEPPADPVSGSHAGRFDRYEGPQTCLQCHEAEAREAHDSVHYQWRGDASEAIGLASAHAGKLGGINDFCIYPDINWIGKLTNIDGKQVDGGCAKCHVGLGEKPTAAATTAQLQNIDCLVCHSDSYERKVGQVNGAYRFVPDEGRMSVSLLQAASDIQLPDKNSCLDCHTKAGGGDNFKRGDIEEAHRDPSRDVDVHMAAASRGGAGLNCLDCHVAVGHKIAGRGTDLRPRELPDEVSCVVCHNERPHDDGRINDHTAKLNCTVCHIPTFAKVAATDMSRDWSQPGDLVAAKGLYEPHHEKGKNVTPVYRWFNGNSAFYQFGDRAEPGPNGRIPLAAPLGDIQDSQAKIYAFKYHKGYQPMDPATGRLLPLKIGKFFESGQIDTAVRMGAEAVGWSYNGHTFAKTERYLGLFHEVAPSEQALSCNDCHSGGQRMDFSALGYDRLSSRNGRALCVSCHEDKSDEWSTSEMFTRVHRKHIDDKGLDCSGCHSFSRRN
ncbi:MAG: multiheme c-type cytochrome [Desulfosarcinaceae bacterium]|nr:multiheme c-type cytochrome [Desulfosarcinaceae bacterium]